MVVNPSILRRGKSEETHLIYYINEGLGIVPSEVPDHTNLIMVREYF